MADPDASRARETSPGDDASTSHAAPDSLQNTPSNIARLEDAIENCAARRKYLARTKSPSDGEDVRWYFCKVPLADRVLSASVPQTDIVGKGDYFRFSMRDCLALEASFLEREESLLGYWWREYAECSEGPAGSLVKTDMSDSEYLYKVEEERVGVPVKGGLYEVDLMRRHCFPVYWNGENRRVLRGHWFARKGGLDWIPLREDVSEQLELAYNCQVWHRRKFQPSGLFAARVDLQGSTPGLHAFFTGEDDTWEAWLVFDTGPKLGSNTIKIRRGFSSSGAANPTQDELRQQKEEETDDYCSQVFLSAGFFSLYTLVPIIFILPSPKRSRGQDYWQDKNIVEEMPCCRQMFNVFHPFDPVAYRVEPLVCEDYVNKRPVVIPYHRGGKRIHVGVQVCCMSF
uniref:Uncharacterized protein n=1 Tax=Avena sativa TaxID=4498 RepID=A0ACD5ZW97_AVESA